MSPPLVVAYALAGSIEKDLVKDQLSEGKDGRPVYLRDIWPSQKEVAETVGKCIQQEMFRKNYSEIFAGDELWQKLHVPSGETFAWDAKSTYIRRAPYFDDMPRMPQAVRD